MPAAGRAVMQGAAALLAGLGQTLFPARCLGCGRRGHHLCPACQGLLPRLEDGRCPRCALPRRDDRDCPGCRGLPPALATVRAACRYEGVARAAVHQVKFRGARSQAGWMSTVLAEAVTDPPLHADLVLPVPLAPDHLRERGYNQAALLADALPRAVGGTLADGLLRREPRPPQRTLGAAERRANVRGAFACVDPGAVAGRRLLLVDDVSTTNQSHSWPFGRASPGAWEIIRHGCSVGLISPVSGCPTVSGRRRFHHVGGGEIATP